MVEIVVCRHVKEAGRGIRDHKPFNYDAQVWATACLNQVPVVFSEDFRDGSIFSNPPLPVRQAGSPPFSKGGELKKA
jgi:predicted nucleic acid-binding protein